jgi:hypothetical protein
VSGSLIGNNLTSQISYELACSLYANHRWYGNYTAGQQCRDDAGGVASFGQVCGQQNEHREYDVAASLCTAKTADECGRLCYHLADCLAFDFNPYAAAEARCRLRNGTISLGNGVLNTGPAQLPALQDGAVVNDSGWNASLAGGYMYYEVALRSASACVYGCTNHSAVNFDKQAQMDDNNCTDGPPLRNISGCMDPRAINYNPEANRWAPCGEHAIRGCTNASFVNFRPDANIDDGSCHHGSTPCMTGNIYTPANISAGALANCSTGGNASTELACTTKIPGHKCNTLAVCLYAGHNQHLCRCPKGYVGDGSKAGHCHLAVTGCMNSRAENYNASATVQPPDACRYSADQFLCAQRGRLNAPSLAIEGSLVDTALSTPSSTAVYTIEADFNDCARLCVSYPSSTTTCESFNYNSFSRRCFLNSIRRQTALLLTWPSGFHYYEKETPARVDVRTSSFVPGTVPCSVGCTIPNSVETVNARMTLKTHAAPWTCTPTVIGCTDTAALNFNASANIENGTCIFPVYGCTNSTKSSGMPIRSIVQGPLNLNRNATADDGSCEYGHALHRFDCPVQGALYGYNIGNTAEVAPSAEYCARLCLQTPDCRSFDYSESTSDCWLGDDIICAPGSCTDRVNSGAASFMYYQRNFSTSVQVGSCVTTVVGCMNSKAVNYNPEATIRDDSTCAINPCDRRWESHNCHDNATCIYGGNNGNFSCVCSYGYFGDGYKGDDYSGCHKRVRGCTRQNSVNFRRAANSDDHSCSHFLRGCTSRSASNFNHLANIMITGLDVCRTKALARFACPEAGTTLNNFNSAVPPAPQDSTILRSLPASTAEECAQMCLDYQPAQSCHSFTFRSANPYGSPHRCYLIGSCTSSCDVRDYANFMHYARAGAGNQACAYGCNDSTALNFNVSANVGDGSCVTAVSGCTEWEALNYNTSHPANANDHSCVFDAIGRFSCPQAGYLPGNDILVTGLDGRTIPFVGVHPVKSVAVCAEACLTKRDGPEACQSFDYDEAHGRCLLKSAVWSSIYPQQPSMIFKHYELVPSYAWAGCPSLRFSNLGLVPEPEPEPEPAQPQDILEHFACPLSGGMLTSNIFQSDGLDYIYPVFSVRDCAQQCLNQRQPRCLAFDYNKNTYTCELFSTVFHGPGSTTGTPQRLYFECASARCGLTVTNRLPCLHGCSNCGACNYNSRAHNPLYCSYEDCPKPNYCVFNKRPECPNWNVAYDACATLPSPGLPPEPEPEPALDCRPPTNTVGYRIREIDRSRDPARFAVAVSCADDFEEASPGAAYAMPCSVDGGRYSVFGCNPAVARMVNESASFRMVLNRNIDVMEMRVGSPFSLQVAQDLAAHLGCPPTHILITGLLPGSVVVTFSIWASAFSHEAARVDVRRWSRNLADAIINNAQSQPATGGTGYLQVANVDVLLQQTGGGQIQPNAISLLSRDDIVNQLLVSQSYSWTAPPFSDCPTPCGPPDPQSELRRTVRCAGAVNLIVNNSFCTFAEAGQEPDSTRQCPPAPCIHDWVVRSDCPTECGLPATVFPAECKTNFGGIVHSSSCAGLSEHVPLQCPATASCPTNESDDVNWIVVLIVLAVILALAAGTVMVVKIADRKHSAPKHSVPALPPTAPERQPTSVPFTSPVPQPRPGLPAVSLEQYPGTTDTPITEVHGLTTHSSPLTASMHGGSHRRLDLSIGGDTAPTTLDAVELNMNSLREGDYTGPLAPADGRYPQQQPPRPAPRYHVPTPRNDVRVLGGEAAAAASAPTTPSFRSAGLFAVAQRRITTQAEYSPSALPQGPASDMASLYPRHRMNVASDIYNGDAYAGRPLPSTPHDSRVRRHDVVSHEAAPAVDIPSAETNYRDALAEMDARLPSLEGWETDRSTLGLNLAMCELAPLAAAEMSAARGGTTAPASVLLDAAQHKIAAQALSAAKRAEQNAANGGGSTQQQQHLRRACLLCCFLCQCSAVSSKHRVLFTRRTIKFALRTGNFGLACHFLETILAHAKKNRAKLEAEMRRCVAAGSVNTPAAAGLPLGATDDDTARLATRYLAEAASCSAALGDSAAEEAADLASLGLAQFCAADVSGAVQSLERSKMLFVHALSQLSAAAAAAGGGGGSAESAQLARVRDGQASCLCSLSLVYAAAGRPWAQVEAARTAALEHYVSR